jgi:hypothetical protein
VCNLFRVRSAASAQEEAMKFAGIDVHKKVLMVVVVDASTPEEKPVRRRFVTMPSELHRLLMWLREQGVEEAVMESTAQYWRSVWLELELHMRLHFVGMNRMVKSSGPLPLSGPGEPKSQCRAVHLAMPLSDKGHFSLI